MLLLIILVILVVVGFGGGWYSGPNPGSYPYRPYGWGLGTVLLIVLLVLLLTGRLGRL